MKNKKKTICYIFIEYEIKTNITATFTLYISKYLLGNGSVYLGNDWSNESYGFFEKSDFLEEEGQNSSDFRVNRFTEKFCSKEDLDNYIDKLVENVNKLKDQHNKLCSMNFREYIEIKDWNLFFCFCSEAHKKNVCLFFFFL